MLCQEEWGPNLLGFHFSYLVHCILLVLALTSFWTTSKLVLNDYINSSPSTRKMAGMWPMQASPCNSRKMLADGKLWSCTSAQISVTEVTTLAPVSCFAGATQDAELHEFMQHELQQDLKHSLWSPWRRKGCNIKGFTIQALCYSPKK